MVEAEEGQVSHEQLQKRSDSVLNKLQQRGLIMGMEQGIQGSLLNVTGAVLERITRERTEVPPKLRLPERAVYLLDPNQRRLVLISNREDKGRGSEKAGLFAEVMELDEEGNPIYRLSNSEINLSTDSYQIVAVGPNNHRLPPSHMKIVEEEDLVKEKEEHEKKEKFISWNSYISNLQIWMNSLTLNSQESLGDFINRYHVLQQQADKRVADRINRHFPEGWQGFSEKIAPINWIISDEENKEMLSRSSFAAGLYPIFTDVKDLPKRYEELSRMFPEELTWYKGKFRINLWWSESYASNVDKNILNNYFPAVVTLDIPAAHRMEDKMGRGKSWIMLQDNAREVNPVFSWINLWRPDPDGNPVRNGPGLYSSYCNEDQYRGLLFKLKADLLLTTFVRGGAPMVK